MTASTSSSSTPVSELADAIETVRQALALPPSVAYGAHADEHSVAAAAFSVLLEALDEDSGYTAQHRYDAVQWCMNYHGMLDW